MPCHHTINKYDRSTPYTFYEVEKRKETIKEKTKTKKTNQKRKTKNEKNMKEKLKETICRAPPPQARWPTLEKERAGKKKEKEQKEQKHHCDVVLWPQNLYLFYE